MYKHVLKASLLCAIPLLASGAAAQGPRLSDGEVRIGVLTDLSGIYSDLSGTGSVLAAKMAIEDFKATQNPSFPIKLLSADTQNKPDVASIKARSWFDEEKVDMIVDVPASSASLAVVKQAKEKNRVVIISGGASTRVTNEDCTPTALHWTYDTYALATGTAKAVMKRGGDTWYFITADYAGGLSLEKDAAEVVTTGGGKVLGHSYHPFPASDFSSYLVAAQASNAKVIALANAGNDTTNAIKQAVDFGITRKQSLVATLMFITDIHSLGLEKAQGMYLTEGFYWDLDDQTRTWSKRFYGVQKRMPTMVQAGVYSAVLHYLKAIQAAGTDEPIAVVHKMQDLPVSDMFSRNGKLRKDGRMVHDMYLMQVKKPSESKYPWDYYHVRQVIPGDQAFLPLEKSKCPMARD